MNKRYNLEYKDAQGVTYALRRMQGKRAYEIEGHGEVSQLFVVKSLTFVRRWNNKGTPSKLQYETNINGFRIRKEKPKHET